MNQRRPLISVVIPIHNASEGLGACLDALERQTTPLDEIIVVNDGPVDAAVEAIADRQGVTFLSQQQKGAAAARNLGAEQAQGEILLFTDADCVPESNWVEAMTAPFADRARSETFAQQVVGVCGVVRTRQTGLIPRFIQLEYDYRYRSIARHPQIDFINTGTAGYRKHVFMESGGFREDLLGAEDAELSFRLASQGHKMVFVPEAIVYHVHPESVLEYARRKAHYSYWRTLVYRRHPRKAVADSRTPQTQKIQVGLLFLLVTAVAGSVFWRGLGRLAGGLALLFLLISLPFWWWVLRRDLRVGLLTPLFVLMATASVGAGVMAGLAVGRHPPPGDPVQKPKHEPEADR
jgi:cellulose synthase/poly-beta-1,6-N-acetylglucosamine synthase-like glycosyltransferase